MNYLINPINNQKVNIFSKQGKNILKKYVKNYQIYIAKGGASSTPSTLTHEEWMKYRMMAKIQNMIRNKKKKRKTTTKKRVMFQNCTSDEQCSDGRVCDTKTNICVEIKEIPKVRRDAVNKIQETQTKEKERRVTFL